MYSLIRLVFILILLIVPLTGLASQVEARNSLFRIVKKINSVTDQKERLKLQNLMYDTVNACGREHVFPSEAYLQCLITGYGTLLLAIPFITDGQVNKNEPQHLTCFPGTFGVLAIYDNTSHDSGGPFEVPVAGWEFVVPEGVEYVTSSADIENEIQSTVVNGRLRLDIGTVAAGTEIPIMVFFHATTPGEYALKATVLSDIFDPDTSNNSLDYTIQVMEPQNVLVYPWVSKNAQFESVFVVNNYGPETTEVEIKALRNQGEGLLTTKSISPFGFLKITAGELFEELGDGGGYMVYLRSNRATISGNWVTNNLSTSSGASPSQGVAINLPSELGGSTGKTELGNQVVFNYLPISDTFTSAPVLLNTGDSATDVTMNYYDSAGNLILSDQTTLTGLEPFRPFATVANNLVPPGTGDVTMTAVSSDQPITGVSFVFNSSAEPAIGNVTTVDNIRNNGILLPWISKNTQFESILTITNLDSNPIQIKLTATRNDGTTETVTDTIEGNGFLNKMAGELFTQMGDGPGYSVLIEPSGSMDFDLSASFVTFNLTTPSGTSPSMGTGIPYRQNQLNMADQEGFGKAIVFGFLPTTNGLTSAPVIVNLGSQNTNVTLYFFDEAGNLLTKDSTTLRGLAPLKPFATVANILIPSDSGDVYLVATSDSQPITGLGFVFNSQAEPSIGNVSSITFTPPQ